jgi:hypothetical protein
MNDFGRTVFALTFGIGCCKHGGSHRLVVARRSWYYPRLNHRCQRQGGTRLTKKEGVRLCRATTELLAP